MTTALSILSNDPGTVRVRLVNNEFNLEYGGPGGRLPAGTAVEVPPDVARRWLTKHIAEPAEIGDLTLREQKLAQVKALLAEAAELERLANEPRPLPRQETREELLAKLAALDADAEDAEPAVVTTAARRGRPPGVRPTAELHADGE